MKPTITAYFNQLLPPPFGMLLAGRTWSTAGENYRFGFNGKENIDEAAGDNNILDLGARIYDSRLGRFMSIDSKSKDYPWQTPYGYYGNSPIHTVDVNGEGRDLDKAKAKFLRKQNKIATQLGYDPKHLTDNELSQVRNQVEHQFRNKRFAWYWGSEKEFDASMNENSSSTSRHYYRTREILDDEDGYNDRNALITGNVIQTNIITPPAAGIPLTSLSLSVNLANISANAGVTFTMGFTNPGQSATVNLFQDRVMGGLTKPLNAAPGFLLNPNTSVTPAVSFNATNGNFCTIQVTNIVTVASALSYTFTALNRNVKKPKSYHMTDGNGHYSFRKVKTNLINQAGI